MTKLTKFLDLSGAERWLFIRALVLLPSIDLGLRLVGLRRIQAVLARGGSDSSRILLSDDGASSMARNITRIVSAAARHGLYRTNCLPSSLALRWFLQCNGIECDLRVGVRKLNGKLEAHAWIEHQGLPLNDNHGVHERFAAFEQVIPPDIGASL